jgi:hypothetical protein
MIVGRRHNTVRQVPLYNKRPPFNWLTFLQLLLCMWIASSVLWSATLMWFPDDGPIRDRNM